MGEKEQGRKIPHSKKNPYIMTIGFDRTDPRHVEVADFLNSLPRKKAQYIVDAVIFYQSRKEHEACRTDIGLDYDSIRRIVLQILEEGNIGIGTVSEETSEDTRSEKIEKFPFLEEQDLGEIMASLSAFRK